MVKSLHTHLKPHQVVIIYSNILEKTLDTPQHANLYKTTNLHQMAETVVAAIINFFLSTHVGGLNTKLYVRCSIVTILYISIPPGFCDFATTEMNETLQ